MNFKKAKKKWFKKNVVSFKSFFDEYNGRKIISYDRTIPYLSYGCGYMDYEIATIDRIQKMELPEAFFYLRNRTKKFKKTGNTVTLDYSTIKESI